jgi:hypothetical protein
MPDVAAHAFVREIRRLETRLEIAREALTEIRDHWQRPTMSWTHDRAQRALNQLEKS